MPAPPRLRVFLFRVYLGGLPLVSLRNPHSALHIRFLRVRPFDHILFQMRGLTR